MGQLWQGSDAVTGLALATTRDERLIAVTGSPGRLRRWDVGAGSTIRTLTRTGQIIDCVATAVLPDERLIAVTGSRTMYRTGMQARCTLQLWDLDSGAALGAPMEGHTYAVNAVATAALPDGRIVAVSGSSDGTTPDLRVAHAIIDRCAAINPAIGTARVIGHRVGIRPHRPQIRLEHVATRGRHIVHNYGHSGSGVSLSWGLRR